MKRAKDEEDAVAADPVDSEDGVLGAEEEPEVPDAPEAAAESAEEVPELPEEAVLRLQAEVADLEDRYLRTVAEFDNFRKRTTRERAEMRARAQADVVSKVLDALDDLNRVLKVDAEQAAVRDVISGVEMVERKLLKELEDAGLKRIEADGKPFDPNEHEAVGMVPAESPELDGTVHTVVQVGYRFAQTLLRPARVIVQMVSTDQPSGGDA